MSDEKLVLALVPQDEQNQAIEVMPQKSTIQELDDKLVLALVPQDGQKKSIPSPNAKISLTKEEMIVHFIRTEGLQDYVKGLFKRNKLEKMAQVSNEWNVNEHNVFSLISWAKQNRRQLKTYGIMPLKTER